MRRPAALITKNEEDASDCLSSSNQGYLDDVASPYLNRHTSTLSDEETFSDGSKKIRKKRNTYQKIADDIRVDLLEAVQNGETLKAAAKRHKINYSSAKSILHTYRKEGRILKKAATERTTKKKIIGEEEEIEQPSKLIKTPKKERVKVVPQSMGPLVERINSASTVASFTDESSPMCSTSALNDSKTEEYSRKMSTPVENTETAINQPKLFDNLFGNSTDYNFSGAGTGQMFTEVEHSNFNYFSNEFDSFNDIMTTFQSRTNYNEDFFQDPSSFLCLKEFNTSHAMEDKHNNKMELDFSGENTMKNFMDNQNYYINPLRKSSFVSYSGSASQYRKNSFDLF